MAVSWSAYVLMGNGWQETITDVKLTHSVKNPSTGNTETQVLGPIESMDPGVVSGVIQVTTYQDQDDSWTMAFTDSNGKQHQADMNGNIKSEDEGAIIFSEVTKNNKTWSLFFPVSDTDQTGI